MRDTRLGPIETVQLSSGSGPASISGRPGADIGGRAMARVTRRLVPTLFVLLIVNFLDRVNVGFAALQMNQQLGFSPEVYGFGAGILFLGYILFEIPSNIVLHRVGARAWLSRIMVTWGVLAMAAALIRGPTSFYVLRFLLGVAEAGFVPGIVYHLSNWFPERERARAIAQIWAATAVAIVIGAPLSGLILQMNGLLGLAGWQWVFIVEGLPAVVMGFACLALLTDKPADAAWLTPAERGELTAMIEAEQHASGEHTLSSFRIALVNPSVWGLSLLLFLTGLGLFGITFWLPQIVRQMSGLSASAVSFVSTVPFVLAAIGMVLTARSSDRHGERRWHLVVPLTLGAVGLAGSGLSANPVAAFGCLCMAAVGMWSSTGVFWTIPTRFLRGPAAAGGLALINAVGSLSGFVGPYAIGLIRRLTPDFSVALLGMGASVFLAAILASALPQTKTASAPRVGTSASTRGGRNSGEGARARG